VREWGRRSRELVYAWNAARTVVPGRRYEMKSGLEPLLRDATVKTIDEISRKAAKLESKAGKAVNQLLKKWNGLTRVEKDQVAGIVIATATTIVTALVASKAKGKKSRKLK